MSGGSMNYMYLCANHELKRLINGQEDGYVNECLQITVEAKASKSFIDMFANDIEQLEECIYYLKKFARTYETVLHACEWKKSGDWSLETVKEKCEEVLNNVNQHSADNL